MSPEDFEKLGVFYLGREYNLETQKADGDMLLYDSRDLVTHGVCVGMTGSGKTGLCLSILEEAAIDNIPVIAIDPKGDIPNLALTFPDLKPEDFRPWINEEDARRQGITPDELAQRRAKLWKEGLAEWGQDGERIRKFRDSAEVTIYTPGSTAGIPISVLNSFDCPSQAVLEDTELLSERISVSASSLLGLLGINVDPIQSREHILLSNIFEHAWRNGESVTLPTLIERVQNPPMNKVGVLDIEAFYPARDRFNLAMTFNNLLASPGFSAWLEGAPLDIPSILNNKQGKPRVSIFYLAHLGDNERMFFVSLLLNQILSWMRGQSGTTSLRALVYMDEIFGFFPPSANPPSKRPLLTMLKQARAYGVGVLLATQNPVDLDYKGLSNTGTWFLGRLQTERDKLRILDALDGASANTGAEFDRATMDRLLSGLAARVFVMHNTHRQAPVLFHTRWAMSYLSGPLARNQIKQLVDPVRHRFEEKIQQNSVAASASQVGQAPMLPPEIKPVFVPPNRSKPAGTQLMLVPSLLGYGSVQLNENKHRISERRDLLVVTPLTDTAEGVHWEEHETLDIAPSALVGQAPDGAFFSRIPDAGLRPKSYATWTRDFSNWLYQTQKIELLRSPSLNMVSEPGEEEGAFRARLVHAGREQRDAAVDQLRARFQTRINTHQDRVMRAEQALEKTKERAKQTRLQSVISIGTAILGGVLGGRRSTVGNIGRAATGARGAARSMGSGGDIQRAEDTLEQRQVALQELETQVDEEIARLETRMDPLTEELEHMVISPRRTDVNVRNVTLIWLPHWRSEAGEMTPAW
ncbi:MAG: ATP-binding protein [Verrucomicrobiales bacterium]